MDHKIISLEKFRLIGIETRTDNDSAHTTIPALWQRFYSENIPSKIIKKISDNIFSLYTDYESDHTKPYTIVIGCKVTDDAEIPGGMTAKTIPASKYAVFNAKGKMPDEIINAWKFIWNSGIERTYTGDFEQYSEKYSLTPPEADIFVAIK